MECALDGAFSFLDQVSTPDNHSDNNFMRCSPFRLLVHDTTKVVATIKHVKWILAAILLSAVPLSANTYTTSFPLTQNPISESGRWTNGGAAGANLWGDFQTNGSMAYGVSEPTTYGDPTAILTGTW